jgi:hypothetical protein
MSNELLNRRAEPVIDAKIAKECEEELDKKELTKECIKESSTNELYGANPSIVIDICVKKKIKDCVDKKMYPSKKKSLFSRMFGRRGGKSKKSRKANKKSRKSKRRKH